MSKKSRPQNKKQSSSAKKSVSAKKPKPKTLTETFPKWHILVVLAIAAVALFPMLRNGFTNWDDLLYVTNNKLLHQLSWDGLKAIFSTPLVSNYHPLTVLSLALNYQISELEPFGYHLTSLVFHLFNTWLVYVFIMKLSSRKHWVALFVALIFAIHPMHVESVAWVSERKDLLYTMFFLLSMIVYLDYIERGGVKKLLLIGLLFMLSLLSKPAAVVLPVVMLLLDYYHQRKFTTKVILEKIPYIALSVIFGIVAIQIQSQKAIASLDVYSFIDRIQFAGFGFLWYLIKFFAPFSLSALHPYPVGELNILYMVAPFISAGLLAYLVFFRKSRLWTFSILFYLVTIALVLQLLSVGTAVVAERYTYVPYIGIAFLIGMGLDRLISNANSDALKKGIVGIVVLICLGFGALTFMRTQVWENSEVLWNDVLKKYPESHRAWTNRGLYFYEMKQYKKAFDDIDQGVQFKPNFVTGIEWRGKTAYQIKNYKQALEDANLFTKYKPNSWAAHLDKAKALGALKRNTASEKSFSRALALNPNSADIYNNRGVLYFNKMKRYQDALNDFNKAIELNPGSGTYYVNRARCYYMLSQLPLARENVRIAKSLGAQVEASFENLLK